MNLRWVFVIVLILSLLHGAVLFDNTGRVADLGVTILMVISIGLGAMMVILGYFGTKAKPNLAFGVRTKWALSNDEVWKRSNLLGGKLLLIVGFAFNYCLSCTLLFSSHETYTTAFGIMFVLLIFGWAIIAIWYSYHVYKEVVGGGENKEDR
ncbi:SdpI family protein [Bacillus sp. FSL W8-1122]